MKINVTFNVSEEALIGISLINDGPIAPARRDNARQFIIDVVEEKLGALERGFDNFRHKFADELGDLYTEPGPKKASEV